MRIAALFSIVIVALSVPVARAQEPEESETKNVLGIFAGALSNLEADDSGPAVGVDYTREVHEKFGIVASVEWASAGEREFALGGGIEIKPGGQFKLVFAPGVVVEKSEGESDTGESSLEPLFVFRSGIGYALEVSGVEVVPSLYIDLLDSEDGVDVHLVYGVSFELPF